MTNLIVEQTTTNIDLHSESQALEITRNLYLAEQILAVIGKSGLDELIHFGYEFNRGSQIARSIKPNGIFSEENTRLLSRIMPDTLIALQAYQATFGSAISEEHSIFGKLNTRNLVTIATELADISNTDLLTEVADTNLAMPPLWSVFSETKIANLSLGQHNAYHHRLSLQPNGLAVLAQLERIGTTDFIGKMIKIMGVLIADNLRSLGQEPLKLLKHFGRQLASKTILPINPTKFKSERLTSLVTASGERFSLDPRLTYKLGEIVHASCSEARELVAAKTPLSLSALHSGHKINSRKFKKLTEEVQNLDFLNGLMLAIDYLGKMDDDNFESFLEASPSGNPHNFVLRMNQAKASEESHLPNTRGEKLVISTKPEVEIKEGLIYQEDFDNWSLKASKLGEHLENIEALTLEKTYAYSDSLTCLPNDPHFITMAQIARELTQARKVLSDLACKLGRHFFPNKAKELMESDGYALINKMINELPSPWDKILAEKRSSFTSRIAELNNTTTMKVATHHKIVSISEATLDNYFSDIRKLIEQSKRPYKSAEYQEKGGVLIDPYDEEFFRTFLAAGNHLLLDVPVANGSLPTLNGLFMYYIPGCIPSSNTDIPEYIRDDPKVSYPELILTDENRAAGTNARLFRGRTLRLQAYGVSFSSGLRAINNLRQGNALSLYGVLPINLAIQRVITEKDHEILYQPDLIPIDPQLIDAYYEYLEKEK